MHFLVCDKCRLQIADQNKKKKVGQSFSKVFFLFKYFLRHLMRPQNISVQYLFAQVHVMAADV